MIAKRKPVQSTASPWTGFSENQVRSAIRRTKKLCELPPNIATPTTLLGHCMATGMYVGHDNSISTSKHFLMKAVDKHGTMVTLQHSPPGTESNKPIVLIGKGVTFDTGGYDIKTANMVEMKFDKCGAMSVIAVMETLKRTKYPGRVVALLPFVQNLVDDLATLPGSTIRASNGKLVEITNTDAEGRLILADALLEAQAEWNPKCMISIATLTGSCAAALGSHYHGLFTNDNIESLNIISSSIDCQDEVWRMPLNEGHLKNLLHKNPKIADIKNYNKKECGGSSAAAFLNYFVSPQIPWVHLDIAGTAWDGERATGRPTRLLLQWLEDMV